MSSPAGRSLQRESPGPSKDPPARLGESEAITLRDLIRETVKEVLGTQPSNPKPADNSESGERA